MKDEVKLPSIISPEQKGKNEFLIWINTWDRKVSKEFKDENSDDSDFFERESEDPFMKEMKFTETQVNTFKVISKIQK